MRYCFLLCLLYISSVVYAQPKLVVGIVIDQMRTEYLHRYQNRFSEDGFKRLQTEGFAYMNAHYNYAPTVTAPGHASIYTGTTPAFHGIVGNDWYNRAEQNKVYCVSDQTVSGVGTKANQQRYSPKRLQASTITDQLKLSTNGQSKVIGLSIKDRGAILPAGHAADGAYWYDNQTGKLVSSSYYHDELPKWIKDFNQKGLAIEYTNQDWNTLYPLKQYTASAEDDFIGERSLGSHKAVFPYPLAKIREKLGYKLLPLTPWGNTFLFDAAYMAIEQEELGRHANPDFLCISLSTPDYMGHAFGPQAIEIEDMYLRLDLEIAKLLKHLDSSIGKGKYLVMLSADHGANENLEFLSRYNLPGNQVNIDSLKELLIKESLKSFKHQLIVDILNEQIYFNRDLMDSLNIKREFVEEWCQKMVGSFPGIYSAISASSIERGSYFPRSDFEKKLLMGYHPKESGDVLLLTEAGWMDYSRTGTTHGSAYTYDTHVPILFFGYTVPSGSSYEKISITDIAPTLAAFLKISLPNASMGRVLDFKSSYLFISPY